jgi:2-succinyl-5-enolpyruvyl-6-hydroxy-3-cyclohexene-1-carboxylate synthase
VCGEINCLRDASRIQDFLDRLGIPCIADVTSMLCASLCVMVGVDHILTNSDFIDSRLFSGKCLIRIGGPIISAKLQNWSSDSNRWDYIVRVCELTFRHDPQHSADFYSRSSILEFLHELDTAMIKYHVRRDKGESQLIQKLTDDLRLSYTVGVPLNEGDGLTELSIARIVAQEAADSGSAVFLSSSMPCRDFDTIGSHFLHIGQSKQRTQIACNRGVNGIDGVISTALGFSQGLMNKPVILVIGDVATIHDLGAICMAFNTHPGNKPGQCLGDLKIVCVNNSGGGIFSFLPIKGEQDVFDPYFSTPHNMRLSSIANAIKSGMTTTASTIGDLQRGLGQRGIRFIECLSLPGQEANVEIHKLLAEQVNKSVSKTIKNISEYSQF